MVFSAQSETRDHIRAEQVGTSETLYNERRNIHNKTVEACINKMWKIIIRLQKMTLKA